MPGLNASELGLTYSPESGRPLVALEDITLDIAPGEFVTVIGPSGCGKSTLLYCLAGLLAPTTGTVTVDNIAISGPQPKLAAFVFQDYTSLPWKTVSENVSIGLKFAGSSKADRRAKASEMLSLVGLADFADAYPRELSGGMQQRVAVARAMAMEPRILLMDEPFGALDEQTRRQLGLEMSRMLSEAGSTVVMVTHSLDEAILWADRIIVLTGRPGSIQQEIVLTEPRPRGLDFLTSPEFETARRNLFNLLAPTTSKSDSALSPGNSSA